MPVIVIQARMSSTRLPGKVALPLGGRPVLSWVVRAAVESGAGEVVVATSEHPEDDAVADIAQRDGVRAVRGSLADVLDRYLTVLETVDTNVVVRLTADCPLLDPSLIRMTANAFDSRVVDYLSTVTPRTLPHGLDVEVVSADALREAGRLALAEDRCHVTSYIWRQPERYRLAGLAFAPKADDLRVTLDTPADAAFLHALVAELGDAPPAWRDLVAFLRERPDIVALNAHVRQKPIEAG